MRYELMLPDQIREAIDNDTPVVLALGVLEYHAEHLCPGVDTLLVQRAFEALEKEMDIVIMPPFYYGAGSYAVAGPERNGGIHVEADVLNKFARQYFYNMLRIGFRNIHVVYHHQSENFVSGMPTDLAFRLAAKQEIFAFIENESGDGWWGDNKMATYYEDREDASDPFSWITVSPLLSVEAQKSWPIDHAGLQETSLMMAFCPEGVAMEKFDPKYWYASTAKDANLEYGNAAREYILKDLKRIFTRG